MSFLSEFIAGGAKGLLEGVGQFAKDIRAVITGKEIISAADQAILLKKAQEMEEMAVKYAAGLPEAQIELNKIEAANPSTFVAGWRPAIGWVGAISLACFYIPQGVMAAFIWVIATYKANWIVQPYPAIYGWQDLMMLIGGMLGFGWLRNQDKAQGTDTRKIGGKNG